MSARLRPRRFGRNVRHGRGRAALHLGRREVLGTARERPEKRPHDAQRLVLATLVVFLAAQVLGILIHGFILRADYQPFYGRLLRPFEGSPGWQVALLPVVHLVTAAALVWVATLVTDGSPLERGVKVGLIGWLLGPAPMYLLWYAEQPWPGTLPLKQLPLELVAMLILGSLAARLVPRTAARQLAV